MPSQKQKTPKRKTPQKTSIEIDDILGESYSDFDLDNAVTPVKSTPKQSTSESKVESAKKSTPKKRKLEEEPSKETKKRKLNSQQEIAKLMQGTNYLIPRAPFRRLVKDIIQNYGPYRMTKDAVDLLQEAIEYEMVNLLYVANKMSELKKKKGVYLADVKVAAMILRLNCSGLHLNASQNVMNKLMDSAGYESIVVKEAEERKLAKKKEKKKSDKKKKEKKKKSEQDEEDKSDQNNEETEKTNQNEEEEKSSDQKKEKKKKKKKKSKD